MKFERSSNSLNLVTPQELADELQIPLATLYQWRYRRVGPPSLKVGRHVRYRRADVNAWVDGELEKWG